MSPKNPYRQLAGQQADRSGARIDILSTSGQLATCPEFERSCARWQLVRFQPAGVMPEAPSEIDRVELRTATGRWVFVRGSDGWRAAQGGRVLSGSTASSLDDSIKFMHVSAPIRVMEQADWAPSGLREFGLDPPGYTAIPYRGNTPLLGAEFRALNPQKVLQYMKLHGRDQVYLMSRFIGEEWEKALHEATGWRLGPIRFGRAPVQLQLP